MADENLIDLARAEDFVTDEQFLDCFAETKRERELIDKLKGPGAHLLEGPRGVGKSSLLKKAELELDAAFPKDKVLSVYVSFKASLLIEGAQTSLKTNPFAAWIAAKVLDAFYKKCRKLGLANSETIAEKYRELLSVGPSWDQSLLERVIADLQALSLTSDATEREKILERLNSSGITSVSNIESVATLLLRLISMLGLARVTFLFDEAAHTFDETQQNTFFEFFKLMHGGPIAVKAATYPGVTSYGKNFEIGQDAIRVVVSSVDENLKQSRDALRSHFRALLQKRLPSGTYREVTRRGEPLDLLITLSHGNPRLFLQTISKWIASNELSKRSALASSNEYISNELTSYHLGLKQRLPRFSAFIDMGMALIKAHLVPELQKKNEGKGLDPKVQTIYFTIDPLVPYEIKRAITLLEYSGFLIPKSVVKISDRRQAPRYALHLGVAANDKIFNSAYSRDPDSAIDLLSIADYREFYANDARFAGLAEDYPQREMCPNNHPRQTEGAFCPVCGERFAETNVVKQLLDAPVQNLAISEFLLSTLRDKAKATTIRNVMSLTETDLQRYPYIGPVRSRIIVNAAEEYVSG
jgi:hypothetical protein